MSLTQEPSSEPLNIPVKWLFLVGCCLAGRIFVRLRGFFPPLLFGLGDMRALDVHLKGKLITFISEILIIIPENLILISTLRKYDIDFNIDTVLCSFRKFKSLISLMVFEMNDVASGMCEPSTRTSHRRDTRHIHIETCAYYP